jgi:hypothetical protein
LPNRTRSNCSDAAWGSSRSVPYALRLQFFDAAVTPNQHLPHREHIKVQLLSISIVRFRFSHVANSSNCCFFTSCSNSELTFAAPGTSRSTAFAVQRHSLDSTVTPNQHLPHGNTSKCGESKSVAFASAWSSSESRRIAAFLTDGTFLNCVDFELLFAAPGRSRSAAFVVRPQFPESAVTPNHQHCCRFGRVTETAFTTAGADRSISGLSVLPGGAETEMDESAQMSNAASDHHIE